MKTNFLKEVTVLYVEDDLETQNLYSKNLSKKSFNTIRGS